MTHPAQEVSESQLAAAVLAVLRQAPAKGTFTGLTAPVWDGWATTAMIQWKLPQRLTELPFEAADKSDPEPEAWYYVHPVLERLARAGLLERRLVRPWRHVDDSGKASVEVPAFRLPGDHGYCLWTPRKPLDPALYAEFAAMEPADRPRKAPVDVARQRQIVQLLRELEETGSQMPPYLLARIGQYALHKSGARSLR